MPLLADRGLHTDNQTGHGRAGQAGQLESAGKLDNRYKNLLDPPNFFSSLLFLASSSSRYPHLSNQTLHPNHNQVCCNYPSISRNTKTPSPPSCQASFLHTPQHVNAICLRQQKQKQKQKQLLPRTSLSLPFLSPSHPIRSRSFHGCCQSCVQHLCLRLFPPRKWTRLRSVSWMLAAVGGIGRTTRIPCASDAACCRSFHLWNASLIQSSCLASMALRGLDRRVRRGTQTMPGIKRRHSLSLA